MNELPKGWELVPIEQVTDVVSGGTPKSTNSEFYSDNHELDISWITPADLSGYSKLYISHGRRSITKIGYASCSAKLMPKGSVLFSSRAPVGYVVIAENEICTNQGFKSFVPYRDVKSKYLYYYLKSIKHLAESLATGTTFKELSGKVAKTLPFPLAPVEEQKRIVEKLDDVLAQVDAIKGRLDSIPAIIKRFRQSVLANAVSGKLTEEWRGTSELRDWQSLAVGDVASVATGKTPKRTIEEYWDSADIPWLTSSATGSPLCNESEQFVSNFAVKDCKLKLFPSGTLLLAMYGEGKTRGQVTELTIDATCNQACAAITVNNNIALTSYVKLRLQENYEETRKAAVGGNQPNLNLNKVREITIYLPSLEEQTEIVRLVDEYFALADTIEAQVNKARARVDKLTQSILAKAFRGELVPQDDNDEPAEKLLERIAQAKAEAEALAKAVKKAEAGKKRAAKTISK
ncbi:restriction endonuclease subunit S [Pseudoalteromonas sp. JC28]|uniref:restriction endonuclease subunit S n=1 Tax=Pseudoalteromonas sp. JC28 TaxID=2267617 RepID=UPI00157193FA|nr:restriction endonuclease subunit S [Pseudoalteromonas sp. JC28]NSY35956.1 restriction endonuclease subunit S [Pseudoalteromonas sp. JC28]